MNKKSTISEIMTRNIIFAGLDNSLEQILHFFSLYKVQHLPVAAEGKLLGILSVNDVLDYISSEMLKQRQFGFEVLNMKFNMEEVMTKKPVTISPKNTIADAVKILSTAGYQSLPVVENDKLVGIITNKDLVRVFNAM